MVSPWGPGCIVGAMSFETLQWMRVGHIFGFVMWIGTLYALFQILMAHAEAEESARGAFGPLEKRVAIAMDIGATLAIVFGVVLIVKLPYGTALFKAGGFFHIKLTLAAALIGVHGFLRVKVKKFGRGEVKAPPAWLFPLMSVAVLSIVIMIIVRPFAK